MKHSIVTRAKRDNVSTHARSLEGYITLDLLPPCPDWQSWSGRWSLWHCSTEAGHAWVHQLFYFAQPPQRAFRQSAPLEEKPAYIRDGEAAALLHTAPGWKTAKCIEADPPYQTETFLRTLLWQPQPHLASAWDLYTVISAVGFGDLLRPRSVH